MSMISVPKALERLNRDNKVLVGNETLPLRQCRGRVLANDIVSDIDVPPADNSAMDGYALCLEDWIGPEEPLRVSQRITAGTPPKPLEEGTVARIFTGAEIPEGADLVVMQERCEADEDLVLIQSVRELGANIRNKGQDIEKGATVLESGHRLRAQDIGLIASLGIAQVIVQQRLKVAIISTGEELVEPGEPIAAGQIYNSNRYTLEAMLDGWGFEVIDFGITPDDPKVIADVMAEASEKADVIITTGGVSVGDEDHVKAVVESLGRLDLWRIAIKPGKPFAFGEVKGTAFLGLPGNPVSAFVTGLVIARPFLLKAQGASQTVITPLQQTALFSQKGCDRQVYLRIRSTAQGAEIFEKQSSGVLFSTTWGDGLAVQEPGEDIVKGEPVNVIPYGLFA
jgi:molybdopterin molybdotransferase